MTVTRVGTPRAAVEKRNRNVFLLVKGDRKFRGFIQKIDGEWRYVRIYKDENVLRYLEGGAMSVDTTILHLLEEYGIVGIDYFWGKLVYTTTVETVYEKGVHKPTGFQTDQYHLPIGEWTTVAPYARAWVPKVNEEIVKEESDASL